MELKKTVKQKAEDAWHDFEVCSDMLECESTLLRAGHC
jgi:hypothetical protein